MRQFRLSLGLVPALLLAGLLASCGGSRFSMDVTEVALGRLSTTSRVDAHPDSLQHVRIVRTDSTAAIRLDRDYEDLVAHWSSAHRTPTSGVTARKPRSFATLWSLELSLASLQAEMSVSTLSKNRALKIIAARRANHVQELQVDLVWFTELDEAFLDRPGTRIELRDAQGRTHRPERHERGPLRDVRYSGDETALYQRHRFYFRRTVAGRDILAGTDALRLDVVSPKGRVNFEWTWGDAGVAGAPE